MASPSPDSTQPVETSSRRRGVGWPQIRQWVYGLLLCALLIGVGELYGQLIDTQILGFIHDDGVYAITAKAMAQGDGFTLLHVVGHPAQVKYPFIYPFLLSWVWLLNPHFPQNLPWFSILTIAFTVASCGLFYRYLRKYQGFPGWLALLLIPLVVSSYFFMYFYSTVMSEAPYLFFSLCVLCYWYRTLARQPADRPLPTHAILILIGLSSLTFLTRVTGLSLMAAIGVWLLLNRQWKNALIYGIGAFLTGVLPWMLWVKLNTPAVNDINFSLVTTYSNYGLEFIHNVQHGNYLKALQNDVRSLIHALMENMLMVVPNALRMYPQLRKVPYLPTAWPYLSGTVAYLLLGYYVLQAVRTGLQSISLASLGRRAFSMQGLYVFFYLLLITFWNYEDQMSRFLTVLVPLLWMYFFKPWLSYLPEWGAPRSQWQRPQTLFALLATAAITCLVCIPAQNAYKTVWTSRQHHWVESGKHLWMWDDYKATFAWMNRSLPPQAPLGVTSDVVFYLYTQHPTHYISYASLHYTAKKQILPISFPMLMRSLDAYGVQYLVAEPHMQGHVVRYPVNMVVKELMDQFPGRFERIYTSPKGAINIYKILPMPGMLTVSNNKTLHRTN